MRSDVWEKWYRALRAADPEAYRKAIQYAEGVSLNHRLSEKAAVACEVPHVMLACDVLGIVP